MRLLSILALLLAVSCSSKSTTCKADTDCSGTEVCNATTGACIAQTTAHCKSNDICGNKGTCDQTKKQCSCGSNPDCGSGYACSTGSCVQTCTGTGASSCTQATQTCQSGTCQSSKGLACTSNNDCGTTLGCINQKCAFRRVFLSGKLYYPGTKYNKDCTVTGYDTGIDISKTTCGINSDTDADTACQDMADSAGLNGKWAAWLATTAKSPFDRISPSRIPANDTSDVYLIGSSKKLTGPVRNQKISEDFTDDRQRRIINKTETGAGTGNITTIFTGTLGSLERGTMTCNDWTSQKASDFFIYGQGFYWIGNKNTSIRCNSTNPQHLYCLEVNQ